MLPSSIFTDTAGAGVTSLPQDRGKSPPLMLPQWEGEGPVDVEAQASCGFFFVFVLLFFVFNIVQGFSLCLVGGKSVFIQSFLKWSHSYFFKWGGGLCIDTETSPMCIIIWKRQVAESCVCWLHFCSQRAVFVCVCVNRSQRLSLGSRTGEVVPQD